jgi:hypothetical protein
MRATVSTAYEKEGIERIRYLADKLRGEIYDLLLIARKHRQIRAHQVFRSKVVH